MNNLKHLAIIMDGNGRWAKAQGKIRTQGHYRGVEVVRDISIAANKLGIEVLTLYAFSTENWKREKDEVNYLMKLPSLFFSRFLKELMDNDIKVSMIGEIDSIPKDTAKVLLKAIEQTKNNKSMVLNFAMNYGSQREIILGIKAYTEDVINNKRDNDLSEESFNEYLMTSNFPSVDLMIRTSGEYRISNFLLYQLAYAELKFIDVAWPDFTPLMLNECYDEFNKRDRRFGGAKS